MNSPLDFNNSSKAGNPKNGKRIYRGKKNTLLKNIAISVIASLSTIFIILLLAKGLNITEKITRFSFAESFVYFSVFFIVFIIDAFRTVILSHLLKDPFPFPKALENSILGYFFAYITPFSAGGQPFQIYHLSREGMRSENASVIILTRWVNMLVFLSLSSILFAFKYLKYVKVGVPALDKLIWIIILGSVVFSVLIVFSILFPPISALLIRFIEMLHIEWLYRFFVHRTLKSDLNSLSNWLSTFYNTVHNIWVKKTDIILLDMTLGVLNLGVIFFVLYRALVDSSLIMNSVFRLSFLDLSAVFILLSFIVYYVPTPGASGGVEGGFFAVLSHYGNSASVMRGILMWRISTYYFTIILGFFIILFKIKMGKSNLQNEFSLRSFDVAQFHFIAIGSGFSGSVFAERIANVLKENVLVIEKRSHLGGNAYDFKRDGIIVQKYGPHIFHTKHKDVWKYISHFTEWTPYKHRALAYIKGHFVPLPFNFSGVNAFFTKEKAEKVKSALIEEFGFGSRVPVLSLLNSKNPLVKELGAFVYKNVFLHYTMKQWGIPPDKVDKDVISRVPINISYEDTYFSDPFQGIPVDGYTKLFEKLLENTKISLMLNRDFDDIFELDEKNRQILLKNSRKAFNGFVIYTGQIDKLFHYKYGPLNYRSLQFMFETHEKEFYQKAAVVNYPNNFDFTRISEFKHFYKIKNNKTIIAKEYPCTFNEGKEPYYPLLDEESLAKYRKYERLSKKFPKLVLVGRLANYKYFNMDQAVKSALSVFSIFKEKLR